MDLLQTLEGVNLWQDMDQPFTDNPGTTEVSPGTPQAEPQQMKSGRVIKETAPNHRSFGLVV